MASNTKGSSSIDAVMHRTRRFGQWGLWFGGSLILFAAIVIGVDVVLRKFFTTSIGGADELSGYALAIGTAWSLAAALLDRAHIRIDSLYGLFPRWLRLALDFIGVAMLGALFALIAWHGSSVVMQSWNSASRSQSALQTPTVIPQTIWLIGLAGFLVVVILLLGHAARLIARGDVAAATRLISTRSAQEEVEDEIRDLHDRQVRERGG